MRRGFTATASFLTAAALWASAARAGQDFGVGLAPLGPGAPATPARRSFTVSAELSPAQQAPGGQAVVSVTVQCPPQYYAWYDSIRAEAQEGLRFDLSGPFLPEPDEKYDQWAGGTVRFLDGRFAAAFLIDVAPDAEPGERELRFTFRFTGCGPDICSFERHELSLKLTVLAGAQPQPVVLPEGLSARVPPAADGPGTAAAEQPPAPVQAGERVLDYGPLAAVLVAFISGLALTFTPCVYPLIPVTVGLIGAASAGGKLRAFGRSLVYVFGISVTYSAAGVAASATGGAFGAWAQHPAVYLALAVLFAAMAGGMFDLYVVQLSSQRLQRLQAALRGRGGVVGLWLVGVLSGAAATACIAPVIVGFLAYASQRGSALLGFLVFFAMAWGMGTPLILAGTFAGLVGGLPRSGKWMNAVKHAFGLALLGAAVHFVGKSRLLPDAWYRWLVAAALLGAATFVALPALRRRAAGARAWLRGVAAVALAATAVWALLPPTHSGAEIAWLDSERQAVSRAREEGRPVLLDYWAAWCAPCKQMLATTFRDPRVVRESERFVCAKVDIEQLPAEEWARVQRDHGVRGVPTTVLIPSQGPPQSHAGLIGADRMLALMQAVD